MSAVKTLLAVLGVLFLLEIGIVLFAMVKWDTIDTSSQQYAQQSVKALFTDIDFDALKRRAAPQMFSGASDAAQKELFDRFLLLGKLESIEGCKGQAVVVIEKGKMQANARYDCKTKFEKDTAIITFLMSGDITKILLGDYNNGWKIASLQVSSDYLLKAAK